MASESRGTVVLALAANLAVAVAKTAAGLLTLSSAMLAEAAHSWADTTNQVFLLLALKKAQRPADTAHPFGYGKERYFWSLLAAVGIFVTGALFSVYQGLESLVSGGHELSTREFAVSYVVLAVAFVLEGTSLLRAIRQLRGEARGRGRGLLEQLRKSNDPTVKTVASEDSAAVVGLVLAAGGLVLHQLTGSAVFDGAASIAIGVLLAWIAYALGRDTKELLIGESADPELRLDIISSLVRYDGVEGLLDMLTMQLSPDHVLVAAKIDFGDELSAADVEALCNRIESDLRRRFPSVTHLYLDPTSPTRTESAVAADIGRLVEAQENMSAEDRAAAADSLNTDTWRTSSAPS
jgi:cation diffusion facilitator family transporter